MDEIEATIWSLAQEHYETGELRILVNSALDNLRRKPGLDSSVRLHASSIGAQATQMLWAQLHSRNWVLSSQEDASRFVSLRQGVRVHLLRAIQCRLLRDGFANVGVKEDYLGWELGL